MKTIQLMINVGDDFSLKSVVIQYNDTGLESDSTLLKNLSLAILESLALNKDSVMVQDLLNEVGIKLSGLNPIQ